MGRQRPLVADLMAAVGIAAVYRAHVRPWMYTWGARTEEIAASLPGDELVVADTPQTTRAVTIDAPRQDVWPWLAQIGEDRGGFYSYSLLERAVGADVRNADVVHPEWQRVEVGDTVWLARRYGPGARQIVAAVAPKSHLVLVSPEDYQRLQRGEKARGCWAFVLRREVGWTRLIVRGRGGPVGHFWFDIPHFVMERKMMRGISKRAQRMRRAETVAAIEHLSPDVRGRAAQKQAEPV
ncbi:hypothetical protein Mycch_0997 [Mycolicibacterium chubuense NBB4]|uniref:Polyketide cyclase / dehydrase and lipid transport n=1 Tax=Mycolicibacterium chubuense (strain NBB4) TaxID=710421 RepID=I4BEV0_MYCCN|nr:hypothetical protein [Mycolicibacterium chubuense]AFM15807.1 hypothetical protein Mycch_0997 [Mycolicibacterium chubuense NBB4]